MAYCTWKEQVSAYQYKDQVKNQEAEQHIRTVSCLKQNVWYDHGGDNLAVFYQVKQSYHTISNCILGIYSRWLNCVLASAAFIHNH